MLLHGSCVARAKVAVLLLGPAGSGKSDLALRLIDRGWLLVADDQVLMAEVDGMLYPGGPPPLRGLLEIRGVGLVRGLPVAPATRLRLAVRLGPRMSVPRLPSALAWDCMGVEVPTITLHAFDASAPQKVEWAVSILVGERGLAAGAFPATGPA